MILKDIYFFEETNQIGDSKILINENKGDMLSLQVNCEGNFNFEVQGCIDIVSDTYNKVFATNMLTSERQENITSNGIYQIDIDGYRRIKLVLNSIGSQPITVYGVMKEENGDIDIEDDIATKDYVEEYVGGAIAPKEDKANKVTSLSSESTDTQYPSAKVVYDTIANKIASVYKYKGSVVDYDHLPNSDLTIGDVYNIETADSTHGINAGDNVAWTGVTWDKLAGTIDLSGYQTKIDSSHKLSSDLVDDTNAVNKFVSANEKTIWNNKQEQLTAGSNISITSENVINATDTTYNNATTETAGLMSASDKIKLNSIASGAEVNVQADWNETDNTSDSYIQNKPTIPTVPTNVSAFTNDVGYTTNTGTITGVTMNGVSKGTSGTVDLGTVITSHQDITGKEDKSNKVTSISSSSTDAQYPSAKCVYDNLITKQDTLISGTNIKTINNQSILGSGNITISGGSSSPYIYTGTNTADDIEAFESIIDEYNQTGKWDLDYIIYKNTTVMKDVQIRMNEATLLSSTSYVKSYRFIFKGDYQAYNTQYNTTLYGKATVVWLNGDYSINFEVETVDNIAPLDNNLQYDRKVLTTDNTTSFTPTNDYHPATKKYVDDIVGDINTVLSSLVTVGGGN